MAAALLPLAPVTAFARPSPTGASASMAPPCSEGRTTVGVASGRAWAPPLDRPVSLEGRDLSLRVALDRVAAAARVRLSYASDLLPLDRHSCVTFGAIPLGDALTALLDGVAMEPIAAGTDNVALAPGLSTGKPRNRAEVLDRVVVTGSATGAPERRLPVGLAVVGGRSLEERNASTMAGWLDGAVPGIWVWEQQPSSLVARYGSIRGASSFGVSTPKMYLDGVEVANPLLVTRFAPDVVERVEVIRGPQGAALYGADAISGVVNIVTRQEGVAPDGRAATARSAAGFARSDFAPGGVVAHDHHLALRRGTSTGAAGLSASFSSLGGYVPDGESRQIAVSGYARRVLPSGMLAATMRLDAQRASPGVSPLLAPLMAVRRGGPGDSTSTPIVALGSEPQSLRHYTFGVTGTTAPRGRWTSVVVAGLDGYRLDDVGFSAGPLPSASDSALRAANGGADRFMVRASGAATLGDEAGIATTLTLAGEQSLLRETSEPLARPLQRRGTAPRDAAIAWRSTSGASVQASVAWRDALHATGGLRLERNAGYSAAATYDALPMLGLAWVHDAGTTSLKLRGAYGRGIRPARSSSAVGRLGIPSTTAASALDPESQAGFEAGFDLTIARRLALHVTRFDQVASGLVQAVPVFTDSAGAIGPARWRRGVSYSLQNVGEITNHGWELQGVAHAGPLSLSAAVALTDSRVRRVSRLYTGELRPGDRMLEVPARTGSLVASWRGARWGATWAVTRADEWIDYDRLALVAAVTTGGRTPPDLLGGRLRNYWREYTGVTRLRATVRRDLFGAVALTATGENLLDRQYGEPDNATVLPGRTVTIGLRAAF